MLAAAAPSIATYMGRYKTLGKTLFDIMHYFVRIRMYVGGLKTRTTLSQGREFDLHDISVTQTVTAVTYTMTAMTYIMTAMT